jgi:pantothenate kinase
MTFQDPMALILALIDGVRSQSCRIIVGIAGAPGSGKSTMAAALAETLARRDGADRVALLPMDGFHLDNDVLSARGLLHVKGAPETFDAQGFVALLERIRADDGAIRHPLFDRARDCTIPDAGCVAASVEIVVVEGNYLLLQQGAWASLKHLMDATIMLSVPLPELHRRLVARWIEHGLPPEAAVARAEQNDMANARTVTDNSAPADLTIRLAGGAHGDLVVQQEET